MDISPSKSLTAESSNLSLCRWCHRDNLCICGYHLNGCAVMRGDWRASGHSYVAGFSIP